MKVFSTHLSKTYNNAIRIFLFFSPRTNQERISWKWLVEYGTHTRKLKCYFFWCFMCCNEREVKTGNGEIVVKKNENYSKTLCKRLLFANGSSVIASLLFQMVSESEWNRENGNFAQTNKLNNNMKNNEHRTSNIESEKPKNKKFNVELLNGIHVSRNQLLDHYHLCSLLFTLSVAKIILSFVICVALCLNEWISISNNKAFDR